jgi:hypothetical protein
MSSTTNARLFDHDAYVIHLLDRHALDGRNQIAGSRPGDGVPLRACLVDARALAVSSRFQTTYHHRRSALSAWVVVRVRLLATSLRNHEGRTPSSRPAALTRECGRPGQACRGPALPALFAEGDDFSSLSPHGGIQTDASWTRHGYPYQDRSALSSDCPHQRERPRHPRRGRPPMGEWFRSSNTQGRGRLRRIWCG